MREMAREETEACLMTWRAIRDDPTASKTARNQAAFFLLAYAWGGPTEKVQQEVSRAPAVMPSEEQMEQLARRVLGEPVVRADE